MYDVITELIFIKFYHNQSYFNNFHNTCNLFDTFRNFNGDVKEFTWSKSRPFIARRLDYIFVTEELFEKTIESNIISVPFSDHRGCSIVIKKSSIEKGPGYWKMNNSLLDRKDYVDRMNLLIDNFCANLNDDFQIAWELLKLEIKNFTINFSKLRAIEKRNETHTLQNKLNNLDKSLANNPKDIEKVKERDKIKLNLDVLENEKAKAAQIRSRVKFIADGEKNTKYFLNLKRANYNSKIYG